MEADEGAPILRLEIETDRPLRARDVGRLMDRLGIAHQAFQAALAIPPGERETLRIRRIWTGSFIAEFIVVAAAFVVMDEARERLVAFVKRLIRAARVLAGADEADPPAKVDTNVVDAGRIMVTTGDASRVVIYVHGDNQNRLEIDAEAVQAMDEVRQLAAAVRAIRARQGGRRPVIADREDGQDRLAEAAAFGRTPEIQFASARIREDWIVFGTRAPWSSKIITVRLPTFLADRLFAAAPANGDPALQVAAALANQDAIDRAFKKAWARGEFEPDIDAPDDHFFVGLQVSDFQDP